MFFHCYAQECANSIMTSYFLQDLCLIIVVSCQFLNDSITPFLCELLLRQIKILFSIVADADAQYFNQIGFGQIIFHNMNVDDVTCDFDRSNDFTKERTSRSFPLCLLSCFISVIEIEMEFSIAQQFLISLTQLHHNRISPQECHQKCQLRFVHRDL